MVSGFATALLFLIIGMMIGFPTLPLAILAGFTASTGPAFSDMGNDLKAGWILRGKGADMELEKVGRRQQYFAELLGFGVAFVMVAIFAKSYFSQGMFAPINFVYQSTIEAGSTIEVMKWLAIWAVPGALIQLIGRESPGGHSLCYWIFSRLDRGGRCHSDCHIDQMADRQEESGERQHFCHPRRRRLGGLCTARFL